MKIGEMFFFSDFRPQNPIFSQARAPGVPGHQNYSGLLTFYFS
jgi:hypothetical protein